MYNEKDIKAIEDEKTLIVFEFEKILQEDNYKFYNKIVKVAKSRYKNIIRHNYNNN